MLSFHLPYNAHAVLLNNSASIAATKTEQLDFSSK
jgi:hypothetical protein